MIVTKIGVDIDTCFWDALRAYLNAKHLFPDADVRLYRTRKGYHVVIRGVNVDAWTALEIRRYLGDDPERLYISEVRAKIHGKPPKDILFVRKFYGGKWHERREIKWLE